MEKVDEKPVKAETVKKENSSISNLTETFDTSSITKPKVEEVKKVPESELNDPVDAVIEIGVKCKRPACGLPYENDASKTAECVYHAGVPVFHEGSKGWTCCTRKVLDFDEFLKIKGCQKGLHRFTEPKPTGPVLLI